MLFFELIPEIITHSQLGTSARTALHVEQEIHSGRFCHYDYGEKINLEKYNTTVPPLYHLENVKVPVAIIYANNDLFSSALDAEVLTARLPNIIEVYQVPYKKFNHADFIYAKDAPKLLYSHIWQIVKPFLTAQTPTMSLNIYRML